ncbi:hypothetical protein RaK2_00233 [Klebsiella phage vB_KleM_RaK2]|uniref:Uncharacterized protein n=1 Tax=Klebsiella phage vB_KleM_RaK2 TaxID=1147094 RepID=H6X440_9CAUD|nr:virion structural protein [Klebsiella phage vB_KleM_RaK2]AFA44506.1 hypothetical protein RaK2_00233 [Klebsiella phage vB_KleM_RaK2]
MKNIIFKNIAFVKDLYTGAYVSGNKLIISAGNDYEVQFESSDKAFEGLTELDSLLNAEEHTKSPKANTVSDEITSLLNGIKNGSVLNTINGINDKLRNKVSSFKNDAQEKAMEIAFEKLFKEGSLAIDKAISDLDNAFNVLFPEDETETPKQPNTTSTKPTETTESTESIKSKKFNIDDIFSTLNVGQDQSVLTFDKIMASDKIIDDMTSTELRRIIDIFIDEIVNSEKGKEMIDSIKTNFGTAEVDAAIQKIKDTAYQVCIENSNLTFADVMQKYFF